MPKECWDFWVEMEKTNKKTGYIHNRIKNNKSARCLLPWRKGFSES